MRKTRFAVFVLALFALPSFARDAHQSYVSYDDGQAILRQEDGREVDVRVNLPVFPGDEVETGRRGRTEIRLADGNIVTVDRGSAVRFRSILDSYEGESSQTVAELIFGTAIFHDLRGDESIRVDTRNATYVSGAESLFSIETASGGIDQVAVFNGSVEIRTPNGTDRLRAGERAEVSERGPHGVTTAASYGGTDFERWYIRRAERYGRTSRYLDRRVAYADDDLDGYGRWIYVSDYDSWAWRPYVSAGWRPYHHGRWHHRYGSLVWHSFEPWGWVPYHYGRWGFNPVYGWIWIPGAAYSHAWVYWAFGPSYLGWIPAGFYDCYRPYYNWAYRPYVRTGIEVGFGFHGRIKLSNIDYRAWTFIDPDTLLSTRVDRAALTTDAIRDRLIRDGDQATVANVLPKLRSEDLKNPSSAIGVIHRGAGGGTGKDGSGSLADVTPFFRRDPELPDSVRDRIVRPVDRATVDRGTQQGSTAGPGRVDRGAPTSGQTAPRDGGGIVPRQPAGTTSPRRQESDPRDRVIGRRPAGEGSAPRDGEQEGGVVTRRPPATAPSGERENRTGGIVPRSGGSRSDAAEPRGGDWRDRVIQRDAPPAPRSTPPAASSPRWREGGGEVPRAARPRSGESAGGESGTRLSEPRESGARDDVPRRVIDRIGGARLEPRDRSSGRSGEGGSARSSGRESSAPQRVDRPSTPPRSSSSPRSSSAPPKRESSGSSKSEGSRSSNIKPKGE